ncbi:MAG: hypothetical protein AB1422_10210 [bacterium]
MKKVCALVVLGLIWGYETMAADLYVPGSYTTIQAAINANAATSGDRIIVAAGTYNEAV